MKRKQKSEKALYELFKREGYQKYEGYYFKGAFVFDSKMFALCGLEFEVYENKGIYDFHYNGFDYLEEWLEPIEEPEPMRYMPVGRVFFHQKYGWCVVRAWRDSIDCYNCCFICECKDDNDKKPLSEMKCHRCDRKTNDSIYYHKYNQKELDAGVEVEGIVKPQKMLKRSLYNRAMGFIEFERLVLQFHEDMFELFIPHTIREIVR